MTTINEVRKWWSDRPCNVRYSDAEVGTKQYFDECDKKKLIVGPHVAGFAQYDRWKGKRVLEIGTGIGHDAIRFAQAGAIYTGLEYSKPSLDLTCERFRLFRQRGRFFLWNAEDLDALIPGEEFDLIYSFGVIHHTPDPRKVVSAVRERMHRNSEFRMMLYAKDSWKNAMIEAGLDQPEAQAGCPIAKTYTLDQVYEMLDFTGFATVSIDQTHIFPYEIEAYKRHEYVKQPWFAAMPTEMFAALEKRFGWHLLITARI
jgi:SAM-dependent methyltransferase